MVDHGLMAQWLVEATINITTDPTQYESQKTGCIIPRKSKHIKTIPTTAEQYLRVQLTWHTEDLRDKIL